MVQGGGNRPQGSPEAGPEDSSAGGAIGGGGVSSGGGATGGGVSFDDSPMLVLISGILLLGGIAVFIGWGLSHAYQGT